MAPLDDPEDHHRLLRLATASGALTTRTGTGRGQQLDAYAAGRGLKDAMAAALRTDDRVHGLLLVGGRLGDVTTFSSSDLALLDTFARHVATSLERGRLEENLRQVTDLKEQLRHQALHDPLTGLPNRTLFLDRVRHAVDTAGAHPRLAGRALPGPRRLQAGQRHLRPRGRRRAAAHGRRPAPRLPAPGRHRRPPRR